MLISVEFKAVYILTCDAAIAIDIVSRALWNYASDLPTTQANRPDDGPNRKQGGIRPRLNMSKYTSL